MEKIRQGAKGSVMITAQETVEVPPRPDVEVADETGGGMEEGSNVRNVRKYGEKILKIDIYAEAVYNGIRKRDYLR